MKDNFSGHAPQYAQFRPDYPDELVRFITGLVPDKENAWDCATGNGQMAGKLAEYFAHVYATDMSSNQLSNAIPAGNVHYLREAAESPSFPDCFFDLVVVAQALHWFDFPVFYRQVYRTLKDNGLFAAVGYGLISITPSIDGLIRDFYKNTVGSYWDKERGYIDNSYRNIPFPFAEIMVPPFRHKLRWSLEHLEGYLNTWSAVKHYTKAKGVNPVTALMPAIKAEWNKPSCEVVFPIFCRIGMKKESGPLHSFS